MARRGAVDNDALAALYSDGRRSKDPVAAAHRIEQIARTPGRLTDDVDPSTALTMAAELCEQHGAIAEGLRLVETALAWRGPGDERTYTPSLYARLLAQSGRRIEALDLLEKLRSQLAISFDAAGTLPDALVRIGERDRAITWLTDAVHEVSPRSLGPDADPIDARLLEVLLTNRTRLRAAAGSPPDHLDVLAAPSGELDRPSADMPASAERRPGRIALLYWPRLDYEELARRWPDLAAGYGNGSWAEHRGQVEKLLQAYTEGGVRLSVVAADLESFCDYTAEEGLDPRSPDTRSAYAAELGRRGRAVPYPPAKKSPCWCGSTRKYVKCCGGTDHNLTPGWSRIFG